MKNKDLYAVSIELHAGNSVAPYPTRYTFASNAIEAVQKVRAKMEQRSTLDQFNRYRNLKIRAVQWKPIVHTQSVVRTGEVD